MHPRKGKNSITEIAKLTGVSVSTVQRVKAALYEKTLAPALKEIEQGNIYRQQGSENVNELLKDYYENKREYFLPLGGRVCQTRCSDCLGKLLRHNHSNQKLL